MEVIPSNNILEFKPDILMIIRKQYNLDKPGEMDRAIDVLEAWIAKQNHFVRKKYPRDYLERLIITNKGSIERAKIRIDKMCTFRTIMPAFFGENLKENYFDDIKDFISAVLPKMTESNYRVYVLKQTAKDFTVEKILNYYRLIVLLAEYMLAHDYFNGVIFLIDYTETNMMDLLKSLNLSDMRQIITIIVEGFGMRLKGIHLLTQSKGIEAFVAMLRQLLSPKIGSRICVHRDIETLYEYLPKEILPSEYGGMEKSIFKLNDELMNEINSEDFRKYIEDINKAKTDESYRQTDKFNEQYMGMPGSFRVLSVD